MATPHATLTQLAQPAAAQIGFTVRRWWRERTEPAVLCVEVEQRLVGAPLAGAILTVAIPHPHSSRHPSLAPALPPLRARPTTRTTRRAAGTRRTARPREP
jgi:hypothetical protein